MISLQKMNLNWTHANKYLLLIPWNSFRIQSDVASTCIILSKKLIKSLKRNDLKMKAKVFCVIELHAYFVFSPYQQWPFGINVFDSFVELYHAESWELLARRWSKLEKDFLNVKTNSFNISKVPDIYDCIKYDHLHNKTIFQCSEAEELYTYAKHMADVVIPQVAFYICFLCLST